MSKPQIEFLVKLRDGTQMIADAANEYLETFAPKEEKQQPAVNEVTFSILKFEAQQGVKLGSYDVAYKANNLAEKWTSAFNILSKSNATIQERYYGEAYDFSYWLYGSDKIYRQKLKQTGA